MLGILKRSMLVIDRRHKLELHHRDRWRVSEMLRSQPDLRETKPERDLDLWRHLFEAHDAVVVGQTTAPAADIPFAEYCWGNIWHKGVPVETVTYCLTAADLLHGATYAQAMSRLQACEAVLGRLRSGRIPIVMVIDDGDGGLECWCEADPLAFRLLVSRGRCPGGTNSKTGKRHRVLWADPGTRVSWEEDLRAGCLSEE